MTDLEEVPDETPYRAISRYDCRFLNTEVSVDPDTGESEDYEFCENPWPSKEKSCLGCPRHQP